MNDHDFATLLDMQQLCTALEEDARQINAFADVLSAIEQRQQRLSALYQADWLRLVEETSLTDAQQKRLDDALSQDSYSILGQDTIWNALSDIREGYILLLKSLAEKL